MVAERVDRCQPAVSGIELILPTTIGRRAAWGVADQTCAVHFRWLDLSAECGTLTLVGTTAEEDS